MHPNADSSHFTLNYPSDAADPETPTKFGPLNWDEFYDQNLPGEIKEKIFHYKTIQNPTATRIYKMLMRDDSTLNQVLKSRKPKIVKIFPDVLVKLLEAHPDEKLNLQQRSLVKQILDYPKLFDWDESEQANEYLLTNYARFVQIVLPTGQTPRKPRDPLSKSLMVNYLTNNGRLDDLLPALFEKANYVESGMILRLFAEAKNEHLIQSAMQLIQWEEEPIEIVSRVFVETQVNDPSSEALSFFLSSDAVYNQLSRIEDFETAYDDWIHGTHGYFYLYYSLFREAIPKDAVSVVQLLMNNRRLPWGEMDSSNWFPVDSFYKIKSREMGELLTSRDEIVHSLEEHLGQLSQIEFKHDYTPFSFEFLIKMPVFLEDLPSRELIRFVLDNIEGESRLLVFEAASQSEIVMDIIIDLIQILSEIQRKQSLEGNVDHFKTYFFDRSEDNGYLEYVFKTFLNAKNKPILEAFIKDPFVVREIPSAIALFVKDRSLMTDAFLEPIWKESNYHNELQNAVAEYVFNKETFASRDDAFWKRLHGLAAKIIQRLMRDDIIWGIQVNPSWILNVYEPILRVVPELFKSKLQSLQALGFKWIQDYSPTSYMYSKYVNDIFQYDVMEVVDPSIFIAWFIRYSHFSHGAVMKFPKAKAIIDKYHQILSEIQYHSNDPQYLLENVDYLKPVFEKLFAEKEKNKPVLEALVKSPIVVGKIPKMIVNFVKDPSLMTDDVLEPIWNTAKDNHELQKAIAEYVFNKETFASRDDAFWKRLPGLATQVAKLLLYVSDPKKIDDFIWGIQVNPSWISNIESLYRFSDGSTYPYDRIAVELLNSHLPTHQALGFDWVRKFIIGGDIRLFHPTYKKNVATPILDLEIEKSRWDLFVNDLSLYGISNSIDPSLLRKGLEKLRQEQQFDYIRQILNIYKNSHEQTDPRMQSVLNEYVTDSFFA